MIASLNCLALFKAQMNQSPVNAAADQRGPLNRQHIVDSEAPADGWLAKEQEALCDGVWADIPQDVFLSCRSELLTIYPLLKRVCNTSQGGHEAVKRAVIKFLGGQTVESVIQAADDSQLVKEQVLGQYPDLRDVVTHVLPLIQVGSMWKSIGLGLGIKKSTLDQLSNENDPCLETLSYWLEHGTCGSVTWKTLLDVLGHFETKHTVDELTDKIVSVRGGGHQV